MSAAIIDVLSHRHEMPVKAIRAEVEAKLGGPVSLNDRELPRPDLNDQTLNRLPLLSTINRSRQLTIEAREIREELFNVCRAQRGDLASKRLEMRSPETAADRGLCLDRSGISPLIRLFQAPRRLCDLGLSRWILLPQRCPTPTAPRGVRTGRPEARLR